MLLHFWHLVWRSLVFMPSIISGNWVSIFFPLVLFLAREGIRIKNEGLRTMNWMKVGQDAVLMVCAYAALFAWAIIHTVYQDHQYLVGRIDALHRSVNGPRIVLDSEFWGRTWGAFGEGAIVWAQAEVRNPDDKPHSFNEIGMTLQNGKIAAVGVEYLLPVKDPIQINYHGQQVTFYSRDFCPNKLETPLAPYENRRCWIWKVFMNYPTDQIPGSVVTVRIVDVFTGQPYIAQEKLTGAINSGWPLQLRGK